MANSLRQIDQSCSCTKSKHRPQTAKVKERVRWKKCTAGQGTRASLFHSPIFYPPSHLPQPCTHTLRQSRATRWGREGCYFTAEMPLGDQDWGRGKKQKGTSINTTAARFQGPLIAANPQMVARYIDRLATGEATGRRKTFPHRMRLQGRVGIGGEGLYTVNIGRHHKRCCSNNPSMTSNVSESQCGLDKKIQGSMEEQKHPPVSRRNAT